MVNHWHFRVDNFLKPGESLKFWSIQVGFVAIWKKNYAIKKNKNNNDKKIIKIMKNAADCWQEIRSLWGQNMMKYRNYITNEMRVGERISRTGHEFN